MEFMTMEQVKLYSEMATGLSNNRHNYENNFIIPLKLFSFLLYNE